MEPRARVARLGHGVLGPVAVALDRGVDLDPWPGGDRLESLQGHLGEVDQPEVEIAATGRRCGFGGQPGQGVGVCGVGGPEQPPERITG